LQEVCGRGHSLRHASSVESAILELGAKDLDVILLNLALETGDSFPVLRAVSQSVTAPPVIAFGWDARRKRAIQAFRDGAVDFLEQPLDIQELKFALDAAHRRATLARDLADAQTFLPSAHVEGLLGNSKAMGHVNDVIRKVAGVSTSVLITGESGTGKGVVAKAIHSLGSKAG